jgi:hypothetical protein
VASIFDLGRYWNERSVSKYCIMCRILWWYSTPSKQTTWSGKYDI